MIFPGASIFQTQYTAPGERTGLKYLQAPLKGPAMMKYYPERMPRISALNKQFPDLGLVDYLEEQR